MSFKKRFWRILGWLEGFIVLIYLILWYPYAGFRIFLGLVVGAAVGALLITAIWYLLFPPKVKSDESQ